MRDSGRESYMTKQWIWFIALFYFFLFKDVTEVYIGVFRYADEIVALCAIPVFLYRLARHDFQLKTKWADLYCWLFLFSVVGLLGNLLYQYQPFWSSAIPDLILNLKFWLAIYVGQNIFGKFDVQKHAQRLFLHIKILAWIFTALVIADYLFAIFPMQMRYGLRAQKLFFSEHTAFAANAVFVISILLSIRDTIGKRCTPYFIWWMALMCTTLRSKAFGAALIFSLIYYLTYVSKKKISLRWLLLLLPVLILLGWNMIWFYFFSDIRGDSARYQLMMKSFVIAKDHFPLGSGFGTFASYHSTVNYSPLYYFYQLSGVNGLEEGMAYFAFDSFWPMVLGQTGYIGVGAFCGVLWCLYKKIQGLWNESKGYYVSAFCILTYLLISSTAETAFVHPLMIPMGLWLGYMLRKR